MRRRQRPAAAGPAMPEHLARFRVEDWCDPTADPPEWWTWANASNDRWSLAGTETVESYWYMRAVRAWKQASPLANQ